MINWLENHKKISLLITLLIALEIFYFSNIPGSPSTGIATFLNISLFYHFIIFFLFSFFLFITIKGNKKIRIRYILIVFFISAFYSALDEFHQIFVPFRDPNLNDILTNTAGILSSTIAYIYIDYKNNKIKQKF
jgi:ABC-type Fe3+-siderophore transport system permease subunit